MLYEVITDVQAGRMNFDDRREWIYDQDLDGLRAYWIARGVVTELSATTTLTGGDRNNFV